MSSLCAYFMPAFIHFPAHPTNNDMIRPSFFLMMLHVLSEYTIQNFFSGKNENIIDKPGGIYFAAFEGKLKTKNLHKYCINIF